MITDGNKETKQTQWHSQSGQFLIESVLIMALLAGLGITISRYFRDNNVLASLVEGPWKPIRSMIENGVWSTGDSNSNHPNLLDRHGTVIGDRL
jgi:hypothetical protein